MEAFMEVLEFMKQRKRMCDYYGDDTCVCDDSRGECPALNMDCSFGTDHPEQLVVIVEQWTQEHPEKPEQERQKPERERQKAEQERQKAEHPEESSEEESSDLYATIATLEDRLAKLETRVENESLILREFSQTEFRNSPRRNFETHKELAERIAKLEKDPVEPMNEPKRTNKDVLLAAFPDAYVCPGGVPLACPLSLDKHYDCGKFKNCEDCRCTYWPAEAEEN